MTKPRKPGRRTNAKGRNDADPYMVLPYRMTKHDAWRGLSGPAVKVWIEVRSRFNGGNNGKITLSQDEAARLLHMSKGTVVRAFSELEEAGFLKKMRPGHWYGRMATEWAVTDKGVDGQPPSREWNQRGPPKTNPRYSGGP